MIHESEKKKSSEAEKPNNALFVSKSDKVFVKCHYYKNDACDCYKKKNNLKKKESHVKLANGDDNSINKPDETALKSSSQIKDSVWWIDPGALLHMSHEKKSLDHYSTFEIPLKLKLTDGRVLYAYGAGNVHLTILNGNDKLNIVLKDVLFKRNTFLSRQLQKEELLLNSKVKHTKSPLMESSTPDKTCCIGKTNNQEPLWNCGPNDTAIWGTITSNS